MQSIVPARIESEAQTDINFSVFDYMLSAT
jgi:hypothetical protein